MALDLAREGDLMRTLRVSIPVLTALLMGPAAMAQGPDAGRQVFAARCAGCHGSDGNGGELGPGIATRVPTRTDQELTTLFRQGLPASASVRFANDGIPDAGSPCRKSVVSS